MKDNLQNLNSAPINDGSFLKEYQTDEKMILRDREG
jgi:hypothetical protein